MPAPEDRLSPRAMSAPGACTIVIPAFDEEEGIAATLDRLGKVLASSGRVYEIVVVDDGSSDATPRILSTRTDVAVIRHPENRGYGAALKTGIRAAKHPLVVVMDADGTYLTEAIPSLVDACAEVDMVVGARVGQNVHPTPARSVVKWIFRQFARWITRTPIPDLNSGLRVFRRTVAERFMTLLPDGFSFTTTITVASILGHFDVRFVPVDYLPRIGRSKVRPVRDTLRIARQLLLLGIRFAPLRTSMVVALSILLVRAGWVAYHALALDGASFPDLGLLVLVGVILGAGALGQRRLRQPQL